MGFCFLLGLELVITSMFQESSRKTEVIAVMPHFYATATPEERKDLTEFYRKYSANKSYRVKIYIKGAEKMDAMKKISKNQKYDKEKFEEAIRSIEYYLKKLSENLESMEATEEEKAYAFNRYYRQFHDFEGFVRKSGTLEYSIGGDTLGDLVISNCFCDTLFNLKKRKLMMMEKNVKPVHISEELYKTARDAVVSAGKASTSYLQRKLNIDYAEAAKLMEMLEEKGVIGPADGPKPRDVLIKQNTKII